MADIDSERKPKLSEYEYIALLGSRIIELQQEVKRLRDSLSERDELIEAFQHTIEYIHTQSQGKTE